MTNRIKIIGVGDDGLDGLNETARQAMQEAEVLIGTTRCLSMVECATSESVTKIESTGDPSTLVKTILEHPDNLIVVLTSGDPLFYGLANYLLESLGKDRFEVVPHVSSMQLAFARVKESWDEAYLANLASVELARVVNKVRSSEKAGLFTTEQSTPAALAESLLQNNIDYFTAYVCENLGAPNERVTQCELVDLAQQSFSALNVVILIRKPGVPDRPLAMAGQRLFGNRDEMFLQSQPKRGLLTTQEVRIIGLALLDLGPRSVVWDVGAGSGSVSIEAARLAYDGSVYAIEMESQDHQLIVENATRFGVSNVYPTLGQAPEVWSSLPDPDAVFIGGAGRAVATIAEQAWGRLKTGGRLVINVNSINNLTGVSAKLKTLSADSTVRMINMAEATSQLDDLRFESRNPSFLVSAEKPA